MSGEDGSAYEDASIRRDRDRGHLRGLLLEGATSKPTVPINPSHIDMLRSRASRRDW